MTAVGARNSRKATVKIRKKSQNLIPTSFYFKKMPLKLLLKSKFESAKISRIRKSMENPIFYRIFEKIRIRPKNSTDCHP